MTEETNSQLQNTDLSGDTGYAPGRAEEGLDIFELVSIILARKRLVAAVTLAGCALAATAALLLPNTYTARAVILPPQKEQSAASLLVGQLGPLAAAAGADLGLKTPGDLYVGLLGSRTIADHLIEQFRLKALYRTNTAVETRTKLSSRTRFVSGKDSLISVEVEDKDPNRAAAMANAYISELDAQNKRLAVTEARQRRVFLERQLADEKSALAVAEDSMKQTQQRTGFIDVGGQTQVAIASLAQLRAQITAGEVALERLKMGATTQNPEVLQTEAELAELRAQLRKVESSSKRGDPLVGATAIPVAGLDYVRGLRDLKYHEFLFELLSKQYEAARIDESKAAPALQVVDSAVPPDRKSGPHRAIITILGCFAGVAVGMLIACLQAWVKSLRSAGRSGSSIPAR